MIGKVSHNTSQTINIHRETIKKTELRHDHSELLLSTVIYYSCRRCTFYLLIGVVSHTPGGDTARLMT